MLSAHFLGQTNTSSSNYVTAHLVVVISSSERRPAAPAVSAVPPEPKHPVRRIYRSWSAYQYTAHMRYPLRRRQGRTACLYPSTATVDFVPLKGAWVSQ